MARTIVYIDGFNLYYRALKGTAHKWLDIASMSAACLPTGYHRVFEKSSPVKFCRVCAHFSFRRAGLFKHPLTCHVKDGVGLSKVLLQRFDRFGRRQNSQVDLALLSFALHFFHHWQRPSASADYKSPAFPGYFLFD